MAGSLVEVFGDDFEESPVHADLVIVDSDHASDQSRRLLHEFTLPDDVALLIENLRACRKAVLVVLPFVSCHGLEKQSFWYLSHVPDLHSFKVRKDIAHLQFRRLIGDFVADVGYQDDFRAFAEDKSTIEMADL